MAGPQAEELLLSGLVAVAAVRLGPAPPKRELVVPATRYPRARLCFQQRSLLVDTRRK